MLKLLLDEHISPHVAIGLHRHSRAVVIFSLAEWEDGSLLGRDDSQCLQAAAVKGFTFVTYDRRTIPVLLKAWAEEGRSHGGVVFIDDKTISPADIGGLVRALGTLFSKTQKWDWTNRVYFLKH